MSVGAVPASRTRQPADKMKIRTEAAVASEYLSHLSRPIHLSTSRIRRLVQSTPVQTIPTVFALSSHRMDSNVLIRFSSAALYRTLVLSLSLEGREMPRQRPGGHNGRLGRHGAICPRDREISVPLYPHHGGPISRRSRAAHCSHRWCVQ